MDDQPTPAWVALEALRAELDERRDVPPVPHVVRVEPVSIDCYLICTCGWVSTPYVSDQTARHALQRRCPSDEADRERLENRAKLRERLAEMTA